MNANAKDANAWLANLGFNDRRTWIWNQGYIRQETAVFHEFSTYAHNPGGTVKVWVADDGAVTWEMDNRTYRTRAELHRLEDLIAIAVLGRRYAAARDRAADTLADLADQIREAEARADPTVARRLDYVKASKLARQTVWNILGKKVKP